VDARGRPLGVHLTEGQRSELPGADVLLPRVKAPTLIADTAFDADRRVRDPLAEAGIGAAIPFRSDRLQPEALDRETYQLRHRIENEFGRLKQFRGLATRYEKTLYWLPRNRTLRLCASMAHLMTDPRPASGSSSWIAIPSCDLKSSIVGRTLQEGSR
jgi:transposase